MDGKGEVVCILNCILEPPVTVLMDAYRRGVCVINGIIEPPVTVHLTENTTFSKVFTSQVSVYLSIKNIHVYASL